MILPVCSEYSKSLSINIWIPQTSGLDYGPEKRVKVFNHTQRSCKETSSNCVNYKSLTVSIGCQRDDFSPNLGYLFRGYNSSFLTLVFPSVQQSSQFLGGLFILKPNIEVLLKG